MHTKVLFSAVLVSVVLSGCSSMHRVDSGGPSPRAQPFTCVAGGPCLVNIQSPVCSGGACTASVDFDPIRLARGNTNVMIRWDLPSGGAFGFCASMGDGIFLKRHDDNDQFDQPGAIGAPGGPANRCKQSFQLRGRHTISSPTPYEYRIIFHDRDGNRYVVDPVIYND